MHSLKCSVILIVLFSNCNGCSIDNKSKKPVIAALLDLHTGENCEIVTFHGLQQLAILQNTLKKINEFLLPEKIEIKLLVFDTCSTTKGIMIATLNALVAAEQTCIDTPFFLGFIGNENREGIEVSHSISKVFNIAYVLPHSIDFNIAANENIHFVSSYPVKQHTEAVKIMFEKLGIQNFIILHENVSLSIMKLNHLVNAVEENICFIKSIAFISVNHLTHQLTEDSDEDVLLIIIENVNILDELSKYLIKYNKHIIISAGKVGAENFIFPLVKPTFILQFASLLPLGNLSLHYDENLLKIYDEQQFSKCLRSTDKSEMKCNSFITEAINMKGKDWTIELLQYGLMLYGEGVRTAANKKCNQSGNQGWCTKLNSMSQKEWQRILKEASTLDKNKVESVTKKITFNMDINGKFVINLLEGGTIQSVGKIEGSKIQMVHNYKFPTLIQKKHANCQDTIPSISATTSYPTTTEFQIETSLIPVDGFFNIDLHDYEMIGILSGIVFGIVFLLSLFVYIVYASVKVKSARSDSSSIGSVNTRNSD